MSSGSIAHNYAIQTAGKILTVLVGLLTIGVLTRLLGPESFGAYTTAFTFLSFASVIVEGGLTLTLVQLISRPDANEASVVGNVLGLRIVSGAILYTLAAGLVLLFPYSREAQIAVAVGAPAFLFMSSAGVLIGVFQKHLVIWRFALTELVQRLVFFAVAVAALIFWQANASAVMLATIAANLVWLVTVLWLARPLLRITLNFNTMLWREALHRSWPIGLSSIFNLIYLRGDVIVLAWFRPEAEVGAYGVAYRLVDVMTAFATMFMGLLLPILTAQWAARNSEAFRHSLQRAFDGMMMLALPAAVGAFFVAKPLMTLVAGPGFDAAAGVLKILMIAVVALFISVLYGHVLVAVERQRSFVWAFAATAVAAVIGYLIFVPTYGLWGAAWTTVGSEILIAMLTTALVWRSDAQRPSLRMLLKIAIACVAMALVLRILPELPVLITIALGALAYLTALWLVGGLRKEQLALLSRA